MTATLPDAVPARNQIVIVAIDNKSLTQQGRWPWPRGRLALMTELLLKSGAAVIGFDILFAEPEENRAVSCSRRSVLIMRCSENRLPS